MFVNWLSQDLYIELARIDRVTQDTLETMSANKDDDLERELWAEIDDLHDRAELIKQELDQRLFIEQQPNAFE